MTAAKSKGAEHVWAARARLRFWFSRAGHKGSRVPWQKVPALKQSCFSSGAGKQHNMHRNVALGLPNPPKRYRGS